MGNLPRSGGAGRAFRSPSARLLRFGFADHRLAAQALERVEIRQVLSGFARLHGDTANGTRADAGTRAGCQYLIRTKWIRCRRITEYNRAGIDPDQCGLPPPPRRPPPRSSHNMM